MIDPNTKQTINNSIINTLGVDESDLGPASHFQLDLNATTQELKELKSVLETKLEITLPEFTPENPATVSDLYELVYDSTL